MIALELGLVAWIAGAGLLACLGVWTRGPVGLGLVAPVVGSAMYAISGVFLLAVGMFSTFATLALSTVLSTAVFAFTRNRRGNNQALGDVLTASVLALVLAVLAVGVSYVLAPARLTPDSVDHLVVAGSLERFGDLPPLPVDQLLRRQFVTGAIHAGGVVTGLGHVASLSSLIAFSGALFALWFGWDALHRRGVSVSRRAVAVGAVAALVLSSNRVLYNIFYINGHGLFAAYLIVVVGLLWAAVVDDRWEMIPLAGLAGAAIVPLRPEGIIIVAIFVMAFLAHPRTPARAVWTLAVPVSVVALVWNGVGLRSTLSPSDFTSTSTPGLTIVIAVGLVVLASIRHIPAAKSAFRWLPMATMVAVVLYTSIRVVADKQLLLDLLAATGSNIFVAGRWSAFWLIAPLVVIVCLAATVVRGQGLFLWGLFTYPVALIAFSYLRGTPYRVGAGDSANRMLMHVVFVVALYLVVAVGQIAASIPDEDWNVAAIARAAKRIVTSA